MQEEDIEKAHAIHFGRKINSARTVEFSGTDSYQVISRYYNIEGKNYVMELEYMNKKHWIDDIPVLLQCLVNIQDRIKAGLD